MLFNELNIIHMKVLFLCNSICMVLPVKVIEIEGQFQ